MSSRADRTLDLINEARNESANRFDGPEDPTPPRHRVINTARSEEPTEYRVKRPRQYKGGVTVTVVPASTAEIARHEDDKTISKALQILDSRLKQPGQMLTSPDTVKQYLRLTLAQLDHEVFQVLFLDVKNRLIHSEAMFRGTLTATSVYPREVVKAALKHNAASVMLAHNHPSGDTVPSQSDLLLTKALQQALTLVDVRVLDHFIVAGNTVYSFAEHGQI